jgi:hypothetical protein
MRLRFVRLEPDELVIEATYAGDAGMPPVTSTRASPSASR